MLAAFFHFFFCIINFLFTHFARYNVELFAIVDEQRRLHNLRNAFPLKCEWRRLVVKNRWLNCLKIGIFPEHTLSLTFSFDAFVFGRHGFVRVVVVVNVECVRLINRSSKCYIVQNELCGTRPNCSLDRYELHFPSTATVDLVNWKI